MIKVYRSTETNFAGLGLGAILPSSCIVKEELNGMFELEMEHPFDAKGKHQRIENENIIKANTPRGEQLFRIYRVNPTLRSIKAYAHHISYDLLENYLDNIRLTNATPLQIMTAIKNNMMVSMPFDFETDLEGTVAHFSVSGVDPIKAILSNDEDKDSIYKRFGGELVRDNFTVKMLKNAGADRGVQIRYGKNLIGLSVDEDDDPVINRLIPIGKDGLRLPEKYIDAPGTIERIRIGTAEFNEATDHNTLRQMATKFLRSASVPKVNIKADIQLLGKTEEYKDLAPLENVQLGDVVTVINTKRNFRKKATVISYRWDCMLQKYREVELGDHVRDITSSISNVDKSIHVANVAMTESKQVLQAISGKIAIAEGVLYIAVDGNDYKDATKVFKFGAGGLQYSSSGYQGSYKTIINNEGNVVK
ncbi:MAG: phage tail spike protein [Peptostreptococcaceae bacterium]|nr:phage tail spike protein [Peptostreptococcaceae bacterium]